MDRINVILQKAPLNTDELISKAGVDSDGAVLTFIGRPRNNSRGKGVERIDYEIYEGMARKELTAIAEESVTRWSLGSCIIAHRYGTVNIGEASIVIAVSSPHRDEAYQASRYIIDTIKKKVPIWKKEIFSDGTFSQSDRS